MAFSAMWRRTARFCGPWPSLGRGSNEGNTQNEKSLYHQLSIDFWCYLGMALLNHAPIGSIMRARRVAYPQSAQFRGERNGCPMEEPRPPVDLPG